MAKKSNTPNKLTNILAPPSNALTQKLGTAQETYDSSTGVYTSPTGVKQSRMPTDPVAQRSVQLNDTTSKSYPSSGGVQPQAGYDNYGRSVPIPEVKFHDTTQQNQLTSQEIDNKNRELIKQNMAKPFTTEDIFNAETLSAATMLPSISAPIETAFGAAGPLLGKAGEFLGGMGKKGSFNLREGPAYLSDLGGTVIRGAEQQLKADNIQKGRDAFAAMFKSFENKGMSMAKGEVTDDIVINAAKGLDSSGEINFMSSAGTNIPVNSLSSKVANNFVIKQLTTLVKNPYAIAGMIGSFGATVWGEGDSMETLTNARGKAIDAQDTELVKVIDDTYADLTHPSVIKVVGLIAPVSNMVIMIGDKIKANDLLRQAQDAKAKQQLEKQAEADKLLQTNQSNDFGNQQVINQNAVDKVKLDNQRIAQNEFNQNQLQAAKDKAQIQIDSARAEAEAAAQVWQQYKSQNQGEPDYAAKLAEFKAEMELKDKQWKEQQDYYAKLYDERGRSTLKGAFL